MSRWFVLVASLLFIGAATLLPDPTSRWSHDFWCWHCRDAAGTVDVILNVALFVPFGIALRGLRTRLPAAMGAVLLTTVGIEVAQYFVIAGRDGTIHDILTNSIGGLIGFVCQPYVGRLLRPQDILGRQLAWVGALLWVGHAAFTVYALRPAPTEFTYFGQWAAELRRYAVFPGTITSAEINGAPLPHLEFDSALARRTREASTIELAATVTTADPQWRLAPIVSVADDDGNEIAFLGTQQNGAVGFRARTRSLALGLGEPAVLLDSALSGPVGSSTSLNGSLSGSALRLTSTDAAGHTRAAEMRLTPSVGWSMWWTPFNMPRPATVVWVTCLWLASPMVVLGYLGAWSRRPEQPSSWIVALLPFVTTVALAHVIVPGVVGAGWTPTVRDGAALLIGAALGMVVGLVVRARWGAHDEVELPA